MGEGVGAKIIPDPVSRSYFQIRSQILGIAWGGTLGPLVSPLRIRGGPLYYKGRPIWCANLCEIFAIFAGGAGGEGLAARSMLSNL